MKSGTTYKVRVFAPAYLGGALRAETSSFLSLEYARSVNAPGVARLVFSFDDTTVQYLVDYAQIEVWREPEGGSEYCDFLGIVRDDQVFENETGAVEVICPGVLSMIGWRTVAWKADTANRSRFYSIPAETVSKTLVEYNAGPSALVTNGRIRDGAISGITVNTDLGRGNSTEIGCAYAPLLETLQKIALKGGGDFDLVKTGLATFEFRWYPGQLGTDRSTTLVFSRERGNIANVRTKRTRSGSATAAIVGGQNEGVLRSISVRTSPGYSANNDVEVFVDARSDPDSALASKGDARLAEMTATTETSFEIIQLPSCAYGVHYFIGDKGKLVTMLETTTIKIVRVEVWFTVTEGETIRVKVE